MRTVAALLHRTRRSPVPVAAAAAACRRSVRCATRYLVAGWRREGPESITVARWSRPSHAALRFRISGTRIPGAHASGAQVGGAHVGPLRASRSRRTRTAARRGEGTESAAVSILNGGRLIACAPVPGIVHLPIGERACTRPLHIAVRSRAAESGRSASSHAAASRNCADMALLHGLPQTCGLLLERHRTGHVVVRRAKETLRATVAHGGRRRRSSAGRQAGAGRNHGQVARHHARAIQLFTARRHGSDPAGAKVSRIHRRQSAANVVVMNVRNV